MPALDGVSRSRSIVIATLFFFVALIAGCGSSGSTHAGTTQQPTSAPGTASPTQTPTPPTSSPTPSPSPTPTPGPTPSPSPTPSASATFVYARMNTSQVSGFRLNADGTLTALAGSPFAVPGDGLAASSGHLFAPTNSQLLSYGIDPQTGALTAQGQAPVAGADSMAGMDAVAAVDGSVYVAGSDSNNNWVVNSFSVAQNGALTPVGSPVVVGTNCELCLMPLSMAADAKYVVVGLGAGPHDGGGLAILARQADGSVATGGSEGASSTAVPSIDSADRAIYAVEDATGDVLVSAPSGQQMQTFFPPSGVVGGVTADRTGRFVVVSEQSPNSVVAYKTNPDGTIGAQVNQAATAATPFLPQFDPSGTVLVVSEDGGLETFKFDPASGALTHVQTTTIANPGSKVVVTQ